MRKFAILVSDYPSEYKPNVFGFIHSRVRAYLRFGMDVDVYKISFKSETYIYEGVKVNCDTKESLRRLFSQGIYDSILIHFLDQTKIDIVGNNKCYIWVHGFEALSWKRRLFNINPRLPIYIYKNTKQLNSFRKYAKNCPHSVFIFVSEWMYQVTCEDIKYQIPNYSIIHNYIDETIFQFTEKNIEDRKKILLIRSFANKKYANDISVNFIKKLSKKSYFSDLRFTIYGAGRLFEKYMSKLRKYNNVEINNYFISQTKIAELQKAHGVFLCPTRQDAQGVSMCEAMSSGLVPITSYNTAIPEFVTNFKEGLLCDNHNIDSFIEAYETILFNPNLFKEISRMASERMHKQCSFSNTILKEIELLLNNE